MKTLAVVLFLACAIVLALGTIANAWERKVRFMGMEDCRKAVFMGMVAFSQLTRLPTFLQNVETGDPGVERYRVLFVDGSAVLATCDSYRGIMETTMENGK